MRAHKGPKMRNADCVRAEIREADRSAKGPIRPESPKERAAAELRDAQSAR